jgi:hypothetical protein
MKHRIHVDFVIEDFEDISHDELSKLLGMQSYKIFKKGEKRFKPASFSAV